VLYEDDTSLLKHYVLNFQIYEYPEMNHHKFIEFYDVRAAESALRALNKIDIAGKQIKLEPGHPRFETCWPYALFFLLLI